MGDTLTVNIWEIVGNNSNSNSVTVHSVSGLG